MKTSGNRASGALEARLRRGALVRNEDAVDLILLYAQRVVARGYVSSQLGNIALRVDDAYDAARGILYTKHRGVSLEEMNRDHLVITDVDGELLEGRRGPSIGHRLNVEIFRHRPDVRAVIHVHVDEVIALFTATAWRHFPFVSNDAPIIVGKPVRVLEPEINVEVDASHVASFIGETNCFVMPNHGVTTLGESLAVAYHRLNVIVSEARRISAALLLSYGLGRSLTFTAPDEVESLYRLGKEIL